MSETGPDKTPLTPVAAKPATSPQAPEETQPLPKLDLSESALLALGQRYELLEKLGSGGMGVVYKARDRETGEVLALKMLKSGLAGDANLMERFRNELRLARRITHRNVCRIYDFTRWDDCACISMEFVDGSSLREILNRLGRVELLQALHIARHICAGLREAHSQGIVHRDLKPENVMLDRFGNVKLMDFGIARSQDSNSTATGSFLGTPAYMAPEQAEGKAVDARADIYALGLVLYEMFTGKAAFSGGAPMAVALKQIREAPPAPRELQPGVPAQVEQIILKCLRKEPGERFQSVEAVETALSADSRITTWGSSQGQSPDESAVRPSISRPTLRLLYCLIQLMYVAFYLTALAKLDRIDVLVDSLSPAWGWPAVIVATVSALTGLAIRLYLLTAVAFNYPGLGQSFSRLFPFVFVIDELWALSPFLLAHRIGFGLAFAATGALLYLPFSQRTLLRMYYAEPVIETGFKK
jgi:hypothetical protein